jgi:hypothetical protein
MEAVQLGGARLRASVEKRIHIKLGPQETPLPLLWIKIQRFDVSGRR